METKTTRPEATKQNVKTAIELIQKFVTEKNYQLIGEIKEEGFLSKLVNKQLSFESKKKEKVLRNYLDKVNKKTGMANANRFLHFLYKKVYKEETAPYVEYSEKELKIKSARKAWRKTMTEAEKLRLAYMTEKKDFYKSK